MSTHEYLGVSKMRVGSLLRYLKQGGRLFSAKAPPPNAQISRISQNAN
jgi:hypothetical protein